MGFGFGENLIQETAPCPSRQLGISVTAEVVHPHAVGMETAFKSFALCACAAASNPEDAPVYSSRCLCVNITPLNRAGETSVQGRYEAGSPTIGGDLRTVINGTGG